MAAQKDASNLPLSGVPRRIASIFSEVFWALRVLDDTSIILKFNFDDQLDQSVQSDCLDVSVSSDQLDLTEIETALNEHLETFSTFVTECSPEFVENEVAFIPLEERDIFDGVEEDTQWTVIPKPQLPLEISDSAKLQSIEDELEHQSGNDLISALVLSIRIGIHAVRILSNCPHDFSSTQIPTTCPKCGISSLYPEEYAESRLENLSGTLEVDLDDDEYQDPLLEEYSHALDMFRSGKEKKALKAFRELAEKGHDDSIWGLFNYYYLERNTREMKAIMGLQSVPHLTALYQAMLTEVESGFDSSLFEKAYELGALGASHKLCLYFISVGELDLAEFWASEAEKSDLGVELVSNLRDQIHSARET